MVRNAGTKSAQRERDLNLVSASARGVLGELQPGGNDAELHRGLLGRSGRLVASVFVVDSYGPQMPPCPPTWPTLT